jgi:hypothetical protein
MRTWTTAAAVFLAAVLPAAAADPKAVVEAAVKAHGGQPALAKYPASEMKFKGNMSLMGLDVELTGTSTSADGGKMRMEMAAELAGQKLNVVQVSNGKKSTTKVSLGGMAVPSPDTPEGEMKVAAAMSDVNKIYPLLDEKRFKLTAAPDAELDGKKASVLTVTLVEAKKDVTLYFDQATGLFVKSAYKAAGPDGVEADRETVMADFKAVDGVQTPMKLTIYQGGTKFMTMTVTEVKNLEKVEDKTFTIDD